MQTDWVLSGNDECVRLWDVSTFKCTQTVCHPQGNWGQITSLAWVSLQVRGQAASSSALCVGSARGVVSILPFSRTRKVRVLFYHIILDLPFARRLSPLK